MYAFTHFPRISKKPSPSRPIHFLKNGSTKSIPFDTCLTYYIMAGDAEVYFHSFSPSVQNN